MRAFQDYEIEWKGDTYVIPSNQLLPVIAAVEEYVTLIEALATTVHGRMSAARLSQAYTVILRAAGVKGADGKPIHDRDVYASMFDGGDLLPKMQVAFDGLCALMIPPQPVQPEPGAPGKSGTASKSSKGSTKRSLARAG